MAASSGFKRIKVTPADEQEVVIHAGAARKTEAPAARQTHPVQERDRAVQADPAPQPGHQPTTLQDIEGSKMPKMQVAIIVIAVCAIIAFAAWYAFFS